MRNVEEVFSALKENLDQVLGNLQDGILLFTGDGRAVLVSECGEAVFGIMNGMSCWGNMRGRFLSATTALGRLIRDAWDAGMTLVQEEIVTEGREPDRGFA